MQSRSSMLNRNNAGSPYAASSGSKSPYYRRSYNKRDCHSPMHVSSLNSNAR